MNCKTCNTPMGGSKRCPNCGRIDANVGPRAAAPTPHAGDTAVDEIEVVDEVMDEVDVDVDLELEATEEVKRSEEDPEEVEAPAPPPHRPAAPAARRKKKKLPARPDPSVVSRRAGRPKTARPIPAPSRPAPAPAAAPAAQREADPGSPLLSAAQLRELLEEEASLVEPGLSVYEDETGMPVGVDYETEVGPIDLLAEDANGDLVVVMIAEDGATQAMISEILERVGWVVRHLTKNEKGVRAIALVDPDATEVGYAASAVAGTIAFKTYRLSLRVEDLQV